MLKIKIGLLLIYIFSFQISFAQEGRKVLIYANKNDFLLPFVKSTLEGLINTKSRQKIVSKATNLNIQFVNTDANKLLRKDIAYNFPEKMFGESNEQSLKDSIFSLLTRNDYFLLVNENTLLDKIEFQFVLYQYVIDPSQTLENIKNFPLKNLIRPIAENNFFVDISSLNYLSVLKNGVKKLFPESNFLPRFSVSINGNIKNLSPLAYQTGVSDSLTFDIFNIYDEDTPNPEINFSFIQLTDKDSDERLKFIYNPESESFKVKIDKLGHFKFLIGANDGNVISYSDTFHVEAIEIPRILSLQKNFTIVYANEVFKSSIHTIKVPIVVMGRDSALKFTSNFKEIKKQGESQILDSFFRSKNKKLQRLADDVRRNSEDYFPDERSLYFNRVQKVSEGTYIVTIRGTDTVFDSTLLIYGISNSLKSNGERVKFKLIKVSPIVVRSGVTFNSLTITKVDQGQKNVNYFTINPIEIQFKVASIFQFYFGIMASFSSYSPNPVSFDNEIFGLKSLNNKKYINQGVFVSKFLSYRNFLVDVNLGYISQHVPLELDTFNVFSRAKLYYTHGGRLSFNITSLKFSGLGLYFGISLTSNKFNQMLFTQGAFNLGLSYNPVFRKKK